MLSYILSWSQENPFELVAIVILAIVVGLCSGYLLKEINK